MSRSRKVTIANSAKTNFQKSLAVWLRASHLVRVPWDKKCEEAVNYLFVSAADVLESYYRVPNIRYPVVSEAKANNEMERVWKFDAQIRRYVYEELRKHGLLACDEKTKLIFVPEKVREEIYNNIEKRCM